MPEPKPKDVYDNPHSYWSLLTVSSDEEFEGQHFERKEAGRPNASGRVDRTELNELVLKCVSAFTNSNRDGGLLVLGIASNGEVKGIDHLSEDFLNNLHDFDQKLVHHETQCKYYPCTDRSGATKRLCLIYSAWAPRGICETTERQPRAWIRSGRRSDLASDTQRAQLCRDKLIVDFERSICCPFEQGDLDTAVLEEYRRSIQGRLSYNYSDVDLLRQIGAVVRHSDGQLNFTNAGCLFFAANPQRVLPYAYIRLLRFSANRDGVDRGLPTYERNFSGSITKQIRDIRIFLSESAFFKTYSRRNPDGGFVDSPEYPLIALDEAVVNAVAHRDYAIRLPIECEAYQDAFVVKNGGRVQQRGHDVPDSFNLVDNPLDSMPRNSQLIEWLKEIRDERGTAFVRVLSEGTRRMKDEMLDLELPSPEFNVTGAQTTLILRNNAVEREAASRIGSIPTGEFSNLYPLTFATEGIPVDDPKYVNEHHREFLVVLRDALGSRGWFIDDMRFSRLVMHRQGQSIPSKTRADDFVRLYPAYSLCLRQYWGKHYLAIDFALEVKNICTIAKLMKHLSASEIVGMRASVRIAQSWQPCKIVAINGALATVLDVDLQQETTVPTDAIIPNLSTWAVAGLLKAEGIPFDLARAVKQHSLILDVNASRTRAERDQSMAEYLAREVFPISLADLAIGLVPQALQLAERRRGDNTLQVAAIREPKVEFNQKQETDDIRDGITRYGSVDRPDGEIELVPICTADQRNNMSALIGRLQAGKFKYRGSERTFGARFTYQAIHSVDKPEDALAECERLLKQHPDWVGDVRRRRLFLVHSPEANYSSDDERSPYFTVKRLLLESGVPCQMLDTPTLLNPDWKDLNLALNIVAKCGFAPWVLSGGIPDADFFVGLSYTQSRKGDRRKLIGFANVFNRYGKWIFYSSSTDAFDYDDRANHFASLTKQTLERLELPDSPSIHFHYSARFGKEDRDAVLHAARSVRVNGSFSFVSINTHHNVRLFDSRPETNGSLSRGRYVITSPKQILLSTSGYNPYRKMMGTPQMLEISLWCEDSRGRSIRNPDLSALAKQVLSLTKLNWASTDSICAEPITTKFAGDIAYLTEKFLRQGKPFKLHQVLEQTPWFI